MLFGDAKKTLEEVRGVAGMRLTSRGFHAACGTVESMPA
jgi:hypothetical protein